MEKTLNYSILRFAISDGIYRNATKERADIIEQDGRDHDHVVPVDRARNQRHFAPREGHF